MKSNDAVFVSPGSGVTIAAHSPSSGKEHQAIVRTDEYGHILGTSEVWRLFVPATPVNANKVFFDLMNSSADSGYCLRVLSVRAIKDGSVAVTGLVSAKLYLTRTTSAGSGGTTATINGTSLTAPSITAYDTTGAALDVNVTARMSPIAGATAGAVLGERHVLTEETSQAGYDHPEFLPLLTRDTKALVLQPAQGIRVVQGTVASVGNIGFEVIFEPFNLF